MNIASLARLPYDGVERWRFVATWICSLSDQKEPDAGDADLIRLLGDLLPAIVSITTDTERTVTTEFQSLLDEAAQGSRTAKDKIRHPWGTSIAPSYAMTRVRLMRDVARKAVLDHIKPLLSAYITMAEADEIARTWDRTPQAVSDEPGQRFLQMLSENGISDRTLKRASSDTVALVAELLNDRAVPVAVADTNLVPLLKQYRLLDLVCATDDGDWHPNVAEIWRTPQWHEHRGNRFRYGDPHCHLPRQVALDPARRPRGHRRWKCKAMHDHMWDEIGPSELFRVFVRAVDVNQASPVTQVKDYLPPFETIADMMANDMEFANKYKETQKHFSKLDAYRTLREFDLNLLEMKYDGSDVEIGGFHSVAYGSPDKFAQSLSSDELDAMDDLLFEKTDQLYATTQEIINFTAGQIDAIIDDQKWTAWKEWGILLATVHDYIGPAGGDKGPWEIHQNLAWLYFLKGRFCRTDTALPPSFRELLFDWLELPVFVSEECCIKYLVPVRALSGDLDDDDPTNFRRRAWVVNKRMT